MSHPDPFEDARYMAAALRLARRGIGRCWPNPSVGAIVLDAHGLVVGAARTADGGRPHAETQALETAGEAARGGTLYVTLEPCAHEAKTPPCIDVIISAGVSRVVCPNTDPDVRVAGQGFGALKAAGIEVDTGLLANDALEVARGHIFRVTKNRPFVQLKLALSQDGYIGKRGAGQVNITGSDAQRDVHRMRAMVDAIMVGSGTIAEDDPDLRCRLPGSDGWSPVRVILDSALKLSKTARILETAADQPVVIFCRKDVTGTAIAEISKTGCEVIQVPESGDGQLDILAVLGELASKGITTLMVEGGAKLAATLAKADLVDELVLFQGKETIGKGGLRPFETETIEIVTDSPKFYLSHAQPTGSDSLRVFKKRLA